MVVGFVLINISPLYEYEVFNKLSKLPEVIEVHPLFGEYDLIAKIEAKDYESIGEIIIQKIKTIKGIIDTMTLTGMKLHGNSGFKTGLISNPLEILKAHFKVHWTTIEWSGSLFIGKYSTIVDYKIDNIKYCDSYNNMYV